MGASENKPRSLARRAALFALQGPRKPWWLTPAALVLVVLMVLNLLSRTVSGQFADATQALTFVILFLAGAVMAWWLVFRVLELRYWESVAAARPGPTCIACGYALEGLSGERCPECGVEQAALIDKAQRLTAERPGRS